MSSILDVSLGFYGNTLEEAAVSEGVKGGEREKIKEEIWEGDTAGVWQNFRDEFAIEYGRAAQQAWIDGVDVRRQYKTSRDKDKQQRDVTQSTVTISGGMRGGGAGGFSEARGVGRRRE